MTGSRSFPERTCIGCRTRAQAAELCRCLAPEGQLWLAVDGKAVRDVGRSAGGKTGRGAWIHPRMECVTKARKAGSFSRAFRRPVTEAISEVLLAQIKLQVRSANNAQGEE